MTNPLSDLVSGVLDRFYRPERNMIQRDYERQNIADTESESGGIDNSTDNGISSNQ